jgi:hypothetical protein
MWSLPTTRLGTLRLKLLPAIAVAALSLTSTSAHSVHTDQSLAPAGAAAAHPTAKNLSPHAIGEARPCARNAQGNPNEHARKRHRGTCSDATDSLDSSIDVSASGPGTLALVGLGFLALGLGRRHKVRPNPPHLAAPQCDQPKAAIAPGCVEVGWDPFDVWLQRIHIPREERERPVQVDKKQV